MESNKKSKITLPLILLIAGIALVALGSVILSVTGADGYFERENIAESFSAENVEYLDIDVKTINFHFESYDGDEIIVDAHNIPKDRYSFSCSNDRFSIRYNNARWYEWYKIFGFGWFENNYNDSVITIKVPNKEYTDFAMSGGIGEYTISGLKSINADIDSGIGENRFIDCAISENVDIDMGVGKFSFENCSLNLADIDGGIGQLDFSGKILGGLNVDCGIGEISFEIDGYYSDYDIKSDTGLGEITIDRGSNGSGGSFSKIPIDIDGGIGEVSIKFK